MKENELLTEFIKEGLYPDDLVNNTEFRESIRRTISFRLFMLHRERMRLLDMIFKKIGIK